MKTSFLLILFFLVISCGTDKPKKPKNLIPKDKMVLVLQDIAIANAAKSIDKKTLEEQNILPVAFVYKKHNIDSAQFAESNAYYTYDVKDYKKIYEQVERNLTALKKAYEKEDSIKKAKNKSEAKKIQKPDLKKAS